MYLTKDNLYAGRQTATTCLSLRTISETRLLSPSSCWHASWFTISKTAVIIEVGVRDGRLVPDLCLVLFFCHIGAGQVWPAVLQCFIYDFSDSAFGACHWGHR